MADDLRVNGVEAFKIVPYLAVSIVLTAPVYRSDHGAIMRTTRAITSAQCNYPNGT